MNTDQLRNGIRAVENTLLHTGGMELDHQIGKNRGENCIVHVVQEEREQSDPYNQTVTFLESHALETCSRCEKVFVEMCTVLGINEWKRGLVLGANPWFLNLRVFVCCMVVGCEIEWRCVVGWSFE